jgi:hypothetical protein
MQKAMKCRLIAALALGGAILVSTSAPGRAALAPIHDRVVQFRAVLATPGLAAALSAHGPIDRIERESDLSFRVFAGKCFVTVTLTAMPPAHGMVGPTRYRGELGSTSCP